MPIRIDLDWDTLTVALNAKIASCKRAINTQKNPKFKALWEHEIQTLQNAVNTMTETK